MESQRWARAPKLPRACYSPSCLLHFVSKHFRTAPLAAPSCRPSVPLLPPQCDPVSVGRYLRPLVDSEGAVLPPSLSTSVSSRGIFPLSLSQHRHIYVSHTSLSLSTPHIPGTRTLFCRMEAKTRPLLQDKSTSADRRALAANPHTFRDLDFLGIPTAAPHRRTSLTPRAILHSVMLRCSGGSSGFPHIVGIEARKLACSSLWGALTGYAFPCSQ